MMIRRPGQFWCPLIFLVTGMIAIFLLGSENGTLTLSIILAVMFVAPYLIPFRIPDNALAIWPVRFVLYSAVFIATRQSYYTDIDLSDPHLVFVFGEVSAAEMVLQFWMRKPTGNPPGLALILFAGLAFMGGTYVTDDAIVPWLTPAFFALLILSWRRIEAQTIVDPMSSLAKTAYVTAILAAVGVGGVVYWGILANRDKLNLLGLNAAPPSLDAGMSAQPILGSTFGLQGSSQRVLVLSQDPDDPHLRALAFHTYAGGTWGPSTSNRVFIPTPSTLGAQQPNGTLIKVRKLSYASGLIYLPLDASYVNLPDGTNTTWAPTDSGPIHCLLPPPLEYSFAQLPSSGDLLDSPQPQKEFAEDNLVPKAISPAVLSLVHQLVLRDKTDDQKVDSICGRLGHDHTYSLTYSTHGSEPISEFILNRRPSYCEYFASAAVIMLRCAGIPARYVIGYYAHEHDSAGHIIVRQRDAHAWAEAYFDGRWQTVDATPAGGRPDELFKSVPIWQLKLEMIQDWIAFLQDYARTVGPTNIVIVAAGVIGIYVLVRLAFRELSKRRGAQPKTIKSSRPLTELGSRFERFLLGKSVVVPPGRPWSEYLEQEDELPFDRMLALKFVEGYNESRFGDGLEHDSDSLLDQLERLPVIEKRI